MKKSDAKTPMEVAMGGCYGPKMKPSRVREWLVDNIIDNMGRDGGRITLDVMGIPGCGKTSLVKDLSSMKVTFRGREYDGFEVVDIPIAQVEEMGDILGFPVEEVEMRKTDAVSETMENGDIVPVEKTESVWIKAADSLIARYLSSGYSAAGQRTVYAPPSWVPKEARPGIILFDDGNRASQRIMKGIMQLVQDYRTIAWRIPDGWTIVFTGNPDNRFNQVTSMDGAQLTRMKHVTMVPDAVEWAKWATEHGIDSRLVSYVVRYPEMMVGPERTNPRTLAEFARALRRFPDVEGDNYGKVMDEAYASLDEETVHSLMVFLKRDMEFVIEPGEVLENSAKAVSELKRLMTLGEPRVDIVNIINDRLYAHVTARNYVLKDGHVAALQNWILSDRMPDDMSYSFVKRLVDTKDCKYVRKFLSGNVKIMELARKCFEKVM